MTNVETPLIMLFCSGECRTQHISSTIIQEINQCLHNLVPVKLYTVDQFDNLLVSMKDLFSPTPVHVG